MSKGMFCFSYLKSNGLKWEKYISYLFCAITGGVLIVQGFVHILSWLILHRSVVGHRIFAILQEILWYNCSPVCGLSAQWLYGKLELMANSSKRTDASQTCCSQSPCPCGRSLQTRASAGNTQTLKGRSGSISWGPWVLVNTRFCLSPPSLSGRYGVWF